MSGCYKDDINDLKDKYDDLKNKYETVQNALQNQLTVTSVVPTSDGYRITFSNNTTVDLTQGRNGADGVDAPYIEEINIVDGNVEFIFSNGDTITLPMTENFACSIVGVTAVQYLLYGETKEYTITQSGVQNIAIVKPDQWKVSINGNKLTVTAPASGNPYADYSGTVSLIATGGSATAIASMKVNAANYNYMIDFEAASVLPYVATANGGSSVVDGGFVDAVSGIKIPASVLYNSAWDFWSWSGTAISQFNDVTTSGSANQLSASYKDATTGFGGYGGSKTFAVVFDDGNITFDDGATEGTFDHFWVTNNTYAALSMKDGDQFAKQFSYADQDWFKLVITAFDKNDNPTGTTIEFYLADFRTATSPGIITEWTKVNLLPLGNNVHKVTFTFDSSDVGMWGMNTPGYFCFDNLAIKK